MIFGGLQRTSTIDFPGILSCVVFVKGCDLNCFYCHNRALISTAGETMEEEEVLSFLSKRRGLLDGVVVSGGEPTLHPDLEIFLRTVYRMGYRIKLDTNGQNPNMIKKLWNQGLLHYVAVDLKAEQKDYPAVCGKDGFQNAMDTIHALSELNASFEVRTTLYPGFGLDQLKRLLSRAPKVACWRLNFFHMPERFLPEDETRLRQAVLNEAAIREVMPELTTLQSNLVF